VKLKEEILLSNLKFKDEKPVSSSTDRLFYAKSWLLFYNFIAANTFVSTKTNNPE
jgi:hypothetical protein